MGFPFSARGSFVVAGRTSRHPELDRVLDGIELARAEESAKDVRRGEGAISFCVGVLRFVSNWNRLVAISSGVVRVSTTGSGVEVSYEIRFTEMLILVTVGVFGFMSMALASARTLTAIEGLGALVAMWLWLFGMNYLLAVWRFPGKLHRGVRSVRS